jgi:hypothetical protein
MPRSELVSELRALRKEQVKSISKMKMGDTASEIERLKVMRAEVPPVASIPSVPESKSRMKPAVESVKSAKREEFPVMPSKAKESKRKKSALPPKAPSKKKSAPIKKSKAERMAELEAETSDEE